MHLKPRFKEVKWTLSMDIKKKLKLSSKRKICGHSRGKKKKHLSMVFGAVIQKSHGPTKLPHVLAHSRTQAAARTDMYYCLPLTYCSPDLPCPHFYYYYYYFPLFSQQPDVKSMASEITLRRYRRSC